MDILQDLAGALKMATELPLIASIPIFLIGYGLAVIVVVKAIQCIRDLFR